MPLPLPVKTDKPLPDREPNDFYPTPEYTIRGALGMLREYIIGYEPWEILDPGAGGGAWGQVAGELWPLSLITGVELRETPWPAGYTDWMVGDYLQPETNPRLKEYLEERRGGIDLIMGNPPFKHAEAFVRSSLDLLAPDGVLVFLLRLFFAGSQSRARGLFREFPPSVIGACSKRPSFTGDGRTKPDEYAIFMWQKNHRGPTAFTWIIDDK